jgi:hypothetical protein
MLSAPDMISSLCRRASRMTSFMRLFWLDAAFPSIDFGPVELNHGLVSRIIWDCLARRSGVQADFAPNFENPVQFVFVVTAGV